MSTFSGIFEDIPLISADRFEEHNLAESKLFFLSHCHADHMNGLSDSVQLPGPLYTSSISAVFLKKQFPNLQGIEILEIESPTELCYSDGDLSYKLVVTTVPAQHCPGSVMFIFETEITKILYTGDFRLSKESLEKHDLLKSIYFDKIYLDSTFLDEQFLNFPTQIESVNIICKLSSKWIEKGENYKIILVLPAQYGYEYLFMELGRKLKKKIHVYDRQLQKYTYFPDMDMCLGKSENESSIIVLQKDYRHFKTKQTENLIKTTQNINYRVIKPTAMYWRYWNKKKPFYEHEGDEVFRVAYSNHSSLNEISHFLNIIKGKSIELNVVQNLKSKNSMELLLNKIFSEKNVKIENVKNEKVEFNNIFKFNKKLENNYEEIKSNANKLPKRMKFTR